MNYKECLSLITNLEAHRQRTVQDLEKQVNEILEAFDFHKVKQVMQALNWKWAFSNTEDQIPSYGELVMQSQRLIYQGIEGLFKYGNNFSTGTGGFNVICTRCDDGYIIVDLQFVVADWSNRD